MFLIEELERIVLMRCSTAREAIRLIAQLVAKYGYGDGGECITIADRKEVWQMEILGEGPDKLGAVWAAQRVPDDHVAVSCNIPRIGRLQRDNPEYFMCSDNIEEVARKYYLWDGEGEFCFWKAFNTSWANGRNFREREFFIFSTLAPSQGFTYDMPELPFSVKPDAQVDVTDVMELLRSTYEGTDMDMCKNLKVGSYSFVAQLRDWLPDQVGGICWVSVDNPAQSPHIPVFCGTTALPEAFGRCGQKKYDEGAWLWQYRRANKLATVAWQRTKKQHMAAVKHHEGAAFSGLKSLEDNVKALKNPAKAGKQLNAYTQQVYDNTRAAWSDLEAQYWHMFGMGF